MPSISASGCNATLQATLPLLPQTPQHISSGYPILPSLKLSVTVWSHSGAGLISHTATHSSTDLLTSPSSRHVRQVTASARPIGTFCLKTNPSMPTHPHDSTSHPILFMLIKTTMLPTLISHLSNFSWQLQQTTPMASPLATKGHGNFDPHAKTTPFFFFAYYTNIGSQKVSWSCTPRWKYLCIHNHDSSSRSTGSSLVKPHSFVWPLKRVPLLNCQWIVCPSPVTEISEFRPDIIGILLEKSVSFWGLFWQTLLLHLPAELSRSDYWLPIGFSLGFTLAGVHVCLE